MSVSAADQGGQNQLSPADYTALWGCYYCCCPFCSGPAMFPVQDSLLSSLFQSFFTSPATHPLYSIQVGTVPVSFTISYPLQVWFGVPFPILQLRSREEVPAGHIQGFPGGDHEGL